MRFRHLLVLMPLVACSGTASDVELQPGADLPGDAGAVLPVGGSSADAGGRDGVADGGVIDAGTGVGALDAGTSVAPLDAGFLPLRTCTVPQVTRFAPSGLPLMETNPGAPVALYIDFAGGPHDGTVFGPYNRNGSPTTFDAQEQADIIGSVTRLGLYYAMFDVNVTTDPVVRQAARAYGWILVTEDASGGSAWLSTDAVGRPTEAQSYCGASSVRDADKSRRIAHELGHNLMLEHSGVWDQGAFYKWEDWPAWDMVYGPIMGGGGYGQRNGWAVGHNEADAVSIQDDMEVIRQRIRVAGGSATGWHADDFPDTQLAALCSGPNGTFVTPGSLDRPDDVDFFQLDWSGGDLVLEGTARDVSTAMLVVDVLQGTTVVGGLGSTPQLAAGTYVLRVRSRGGYAEIGAYDLRARH